MIFIRESNIHGRGVFTDTPIGAGVNIFLVADLSRYKKFPTWITKIGSMVNHDNHPNCVLKKQGNKFYLYTNRDLSPHEELTADYRLNPAPFKSDVTGYKN